MLLYREMKKLIYIVIMSLLFVSNSFAERKILYNANCLSKEDVEYQSFEVNYFVKEILKKEPDDWKCQYCSKTIAIIEFEKDGKEYRFWTRNISKKDYFRNEGLPSRMKGAVIEYDDETLQILDSYDFYALEDEQRAYLLQKTAPKLTGKEMYEMTKKAIRISK